MRDSLPPMGKFLRLRCVCAPQYRVSSTTISPNASDSVLVLDGIEGALDSLGPEAAEALIFVRSTESCGNDRAAATGAGCPACLVKPAKELK